MGQNRAARRRAMRNKIGKYQDMISTMKLIEMNERILQQGIGQADLDQARDEGRAKGFEEAGRITALSSLAAAVRVLKRDYRFTDDQLIDFLSEMDLMVMTMLDHQEMIQETLDETGILIQFGEGVERIQRKEKRPILCPTCMMGDQVSSGAYDCDAIDGLTAGKTICEHYRNRDGGLPF